MNINPTYQSGFASPQRGRLKYPGLWKSCVGAWAPCLGPTGLVLRDHSGFGNHGTLTNGPTWGVSGGRQALNFDGTNDYVSCGSAAGNLTEILPFTVSAWCYARTWPSFCGLVSRDESGPYAFALRGTSSATFSLLCDSAALTTPTAYASNTWHHVTAVLKSGYRELFVNGTSAISSSAAFTVTANSDELRIGTDYIADPVRVWDGFISEIRIYNCALSTQSIRLLATRPGIAYELAPHRRSSILVPPFRAAWLNQRSQIIGGGVR